MTGFRVKEIAAFMAIDPDDDAEGVVCFESPGGPIPMIAADDVRLESLRPIAQQVAKGTGRSIKLVRFTQREEVETIEP